MAKNNRVDADDYLSLLGMLGSECLALSLSKEMTISGLEPSYKKLDADLMYDLAAEGATKSADLVVGVASLAHRSFREDRSLSECRGRVVSSYR